MANIDLLRSLCQATGIPSREDKVRDVVVAELRPLVDELTSDALGNLIGRKNGTGGPTVMISAHMDEIGFLVKHIDDSGFIRFQPVGGFDPRVLVAQRALIHTRSGEVLPALVEPSSKPIHLLQPGDSRDTKIEDIFLDLGLPADTVKEKVAIGDMVTLDRETVIVGHTVASKALDDRVGVYVMLEAIRKVGAHAATIVAVASTQEEVGLRGAGTAAFAVNPDIGIALDVTMAGDIPGAAPENAVTRLHGGAAIKIMDSSHLSNPKLVGHLRDIAIEHSIPYQMEILPRGGTDAAALQRAQAGSAAVTISIPTRYLHSVNEMASLADIDACVDLLARFLEAAGSRSYNYEV
ncbi:MAG TPA: M42 family metallopeptidase [Thermomicrobiales bacterium]|nr:M42 family metallopeptidase [Thermomicrobiales bacterium]